MKSTFSLIIILSFGVLLSACEDGEKTTPPVTQTVVGNMDNGKIYYQGNCAICHGGSGKNVTTGFGARSLAGLDTKIKSDMSDLGGTFLLMSNYTNLSKQRVADLQAYLKTP